MTAAPTSRWDLVVVGAGPAGAAAALGALDADPALRVLLLDRADFPRDKSCGDGIAPHVLRRPRRRRRARRRRRLDAAARRSSSPAASPRRARPWPGRSTSSRARSSTPGWWRAPSTAGAVLRAAPGVRAAPPRRRGRARRPRHAPGSWSAPTAPTRWSGPAVATPATGPARAGDPRLRADPAGRRGTQVIRYGDRRQPAYAWAFDRGDGLSNVGYGELLPARRADDAAPSRALLLDQLERAAPRRGGDGRATGAATTCRCRAGAGTSPTDRCCWSATRPGWSTR